MNQFLSLTGTSAGAKAVTALFNSGRIENLAANGSGAKFSYNESPHKKSKWEVTASYATVKAAIANYDDHVKVEFAVLSIEGVTHAVTEEIDGSDIVFVFDGGSSTSDVYVEKNGRSIKYNVNHTYAATTTLLNTVASQSTTDVIGTATITTANITTLNVTGTSTISGGFDIIKSVASASTDGMDVDMNVTVALSAAEEVNGFDIHVDGLAADADTSLLNGVKIAINSPTTSRADATGILVDVASVRSTADTDQAFLAGFSGTLNNAGASWYGIRVAAPGTYTHTNGSWYGSHILNTTLISNGNAYGEYIDMSSTDMINNKYGIYINKNLTNNSADPYAQTNNALYVRQNTGSKSTGASTVSNVTALFSQTNQAEAASADVYSGKALSVIYSATTAAAGTATNTAIGLHVSYTLNETAGVLTSNSFSCAHVEFITSGTPVINAGTYNFLLLEGTNDASPAYAATSYVNGLNIDMSAMIVTDADLSLAGLSITMPAVGTSAQNAITTNGRIFTSSAPTGINLSAISIGTYATPVVDANASDAFAFTINMSTAVNKTGAGDSCMGAYVRVSNTADGANTRLQGVLASTAVAFDCYDAYGLQSNMTISAGAVATGNLAAVSGKVIVSDAVATGIISAGLFTLEGAFNPAALTYGVWIDITAGITADSGLIINNNASTCTNGINLTGTFTSHITSSTSMVIDMPVPALGAGFGNAAIAKWLPYGRKGISGMKVTEFYLDLTGLNSSGTQDDIIGDLGEVDCNFGQITAAIHGAVDTIEIICTEAPTGADPDIDFYVATVATGAEDALITDLVETPLLVSGANWTIGRTQYATGLPAADTYLYLACGAGAGGDNLYTAGKFIIRIYGS